MDFTVDDLIAFAREHQGDDWLTPVQKLSFTYRVEGDDIILKTSISNERKLTRGPLDSFLTQFKESRSFRPGDYPAHWHKSYVIPLVRAFLRDKENQTAAPSKPRTDRSDEMILTAYFLAKYSRNEPKTGSDYPVPVETGCATWEQVYKQLHPMLNDGRGLDHFKNSIAGSIKGIGEKVLAGKPLEGKAADIVRDWEGRKREDLWAEVRKNFTGVPQDSPKVVRLKEKLREVQPTAAPAAPKALKRIRRIITAYERPSAITRYVKRTRGACCQLCGEEHFVKRSGLRYSEVHHIFQLSKNPPADCLSPDYLVCVCATCHRKLHYSDTSDPAKMEGGWQLTMCGKPYSFNTKPI